MNKIANATATEDGGFILELRRTFQAERSRVFEAFTKAEMLAQWWGPAGVSAPRVELDLRRGGAFAIDMHHDNGAIHYLSGVYEEITPPERLVYSWAWGQGEDKGPSTHVVLEFHEVAGGTEIVLTHSGFPSEDARGQHNGGWTGCLDSLAAYLEQ